MTILQSERLILRPPRAADIATMEAWLGDYDVASRMARVPHPYHEVHAEDFVSRMGAHSDPHSQSFSIQNKANGLFLGGCGLHLRGGDFEFGYWLGKPWWGQGFATEAAGRLVRHAFETLGLDRVRAGWFHDNPASGHVLAKLGARHSGSNWRDCAARGTAVLCHDMLLTREEFLRKRAA